MLVSNPAISIRSSVYKVHLSTDGWMDLTDLGSSGCFPGDHLSQAAASLGTK